MIDGVSFRLSLCVHTFFYKWLSVWKRALIARLPHHVPLYFNVYRTFMYIVCVCMYDVCVMYVCMYACVFMYVCMYVCI